jgi:hypothetical protein
LDRVRRAYDTDSKARELREAYIKDPADPACKGYRMLGNLMRKIDKGRYQLLVPADAKVREWALSESHDAVGCGHMGRDKTYEKLSRRFFWKGMGRDVTEYCSTCLICQFSKKRKHSPDGLIHPLPVPRRRWQVVTVDFVTGLPKTKKGYNAIATFTDKLSKMVHLVPYEFSDSSSLNIARMYIDNIWRLHGAPMQIVCDRDPRLVSRFFKDFNKLLGTRIASTTAFNPAGDGQSENTNQTMEQILRTLVEPHQRDWDLFLSQVEYAINDSSHAVHGYTPFQLNSGEPSYNTVDWVLEAQREEPVANFQAQRFANQICEMLNRTRAALQEANKRTAERSKKYRRDVTYEKGDRVLLATKNLVITSDKGTKAKLRRPYCGPFTITKVVRTSSGTPHAYELNLPAHWRCHPVFKTNLLEPYLDGSYLFPGRVQEPPPVPTLLDNGETYFEVEKIVVDRVTRVRRGNRTVEEKQWLTRFKGEGPTGDLWLPIERFVDALGECEEWTRYEKAVKDKANWITAMSRPTALLSDYDRFPVLEAALTLRRNRYESRRREAQENCSYIQLYEDQIRGESVLEPAVGDTAEFGSVRPISCLPSQQPRRVRVLVLFCGTGSVERAAHDMFPDAEVISVDNRSKWAPTHCANILDWADPHSLANYTQYSRGYFDIIWASPPCEQYSQAHTVGTRNLTAADERVKASLRVIDALAPTYWFKENPRSYDPVGLAYRPFMAHLEDFRHLCT